MTKVRKEKKGKPKGIEFSIPFNSDLDLMKWAIRSGRVYEVYFAGPGQYDFSDPYEESVEFTNKKVFSLVEFCNQNGIETNLLVNKGVLFFENGRAISRYIASFDSVGGIDSVTVADPFLIPFFRERFPNIVLQSSVYMGINNLNKAIQAIKKGISVLGLEPSINRNAFELKRIMALKKKFAHISIKLLGNHVCYADCMYYPRHSQLPVFSDVLKEKYPKESDYILGRNIEPFKCHYRIQTLKDEITRTFIRPEDVEYYEKNKLTDSIKIAFRNDESAKLKEKINAYFQRSYDGDLFGLFDSNNPEKLICDNKKFPRGFIEKVMNCDKNCGNCSYCDIVAKKCIRNDTPVGKARRIARPCLRMGNSRQSNLKLLVLDDRDFYSIEPGFYITHGLLSSYDTFGEFGACRNNCIFCCTPGPRKHSSSRFSTSMRRSNLIKKNKIILCEGEPTNLPDIIRKISYLKTKYDVAALTTNGRRLKDIDFARRLFRAGINEVVFSLHGHTSGINDKLTRVEGSFDEAVRGIRNTVSIKESNRQDLKIGVSFVITKSNINFLHDFSLLVNELKVETVHFNTLVPFGSGKKIFKKEMPSYSYILSEFNKLKDKCMQDRNLSRLRVILSTMPFCVVDKVCRHLGYTLLLNKTGEFLHLRDRVCRYICEICDFNSYCEGIFEDYAKIYGLEEFRYTSGKLRENSKAESFNGFNKRPDQNISSIKPAQRHVNSLMVIPTRACQFVCNYCKIKLSNRSMPLEVLNKAIDLLLTTERDECQLRFWGGEPLLRWDFVKKGIRQGQRKSRQRGKKIKFMITTNGLSLDRKKIDFLKHYPVEIMFSIDGGKAVNEAHRLLTTKKPYYDRLLGNLRLLIESGLPYFVNAVVTPKTVDKLSESLEFLRNSGVARVQVGYQCGIFWPKQKKDLLIKELKEFISKHRDDEFIMNFTNDCEPTMLSQEIVVDTEGKVYFDGAVFMEKKFPKLKNYYFLGEVDKIGPIDALYRSRRDLYPIFKKACSREQKNILLDNVNLGLKLDSFFNSISYESLRSNEHPLLIPVIKGGFPVQREVLERIKLNSLFLFLEGPCLNDCLFCRQKQEDNFNDLFKVEYKLKSNLKIRTKKLCIIGNEPLLYPEIKETVHLAKKYGFKEIEIMTSGDLLCDVTFAREIIKRGATSFSLPIFSCNDEVHDNIVGRSGSLSRVRKAVANVLNLGAKVFIHANLMKQNIGYLKDLELFVKDKLGLPFVILPIRPKTMKLPFKELMPSYDEIIKELKGINSLLGFPLCVVRRVQKNLFKSDEEISDSMKLYLLDQKFSKTAACKNCSYINKCLGIFKEYGYLYSLGQIKPFS